MKLDNLKANPEISRMEATTTLCCLKMPKGIQESMEFMLWIFKQSQLHNILFLACKFLGLLSNLGKSVRSLSCRSFRFQGISSFVFSNESQILFELKMHQGFITVCAAFLNSLNRREIPFFIIIDEDKILFL